LERKALDSCGRSGTGETPQERSDEEAHRPPRGKRAPVAEINYYMPSEMTPIAKCPWQITDDYGSNVRSTNPIKKCTIQTVDEEKKKRYTTNNFILLAH
jgi:hypothetical protein